MLLKLLKEWVAQRLLSMGPCYLNWLISNKVIFESKPSGLCYMNSGGRGHSGLQSKGRASIPGWVHLRSEGGSQLVTWTLTLMSVQRHVNYKMQKLRMKKLRVTCTQALHLIIAVYHVHPSILPLLNQNYIRVILAHFPLNFSWIENKVYCLFFIFFSSYFLAHLGYLQFGAGRHKINIIIIVETYLLIVLSIL